MDWLEIESETALLTGLYEGQSKGQTNTNGCETSMG
jgi:hypothetical protein